MEELKSLLKIILVFGTRPPWLARLPRVRRRIGELAAAQANRYHSHSFCLYSPVPQIISGRMRTFSTRGGGGGLGWGLLGRQAKDKQPQNGEYGALQQGGGNALPGSVQQLQWLQCSSAVWAGQCTAVVGKNAAVSALHHCMSIP